MNAPIARKLVQLSPSDLSLLEDCTEESVYAPGYIQPHGVVLALQEPDLTIIQISETVDRFFGVSAETVLGQPLQRLFPQTQVQHIADLLTQDQIAVCNPLELTIPRGGRSTSSHRKTQRFRSMLYRTADCLVLELEPLPSPPNNSLLWFYHQLQVAILQFRSATSFEEISQTIAHEVRALTGFDRVMVYRFEADEHGVVIAEEKADHLETFLGLHFPSFDIPAPARQLFCRNWVRYIPDINYLPAPLVSHVDAANPLDLSDSVLRGVSPYHVEYLQNMGVGSSLTISLIDDKRLWGLIACHHYSPRFVDYETRKTCEFLGQFASIELANQQDRELEHYQTQVKAIQDKLQHAFEQKPDFIQQVLTRNATELLDLVRANGLAIALDGQLTLIGQTPSLAQVQALLDWLLQLKQHEIYLTDCLTRSYPAAKAFTKTASGILVISIVLHPKAYHLIWFRPEQVQTVNWAGCPHDAVAIDDFGKIHLCPRKSFELWKETVEATSLPWEIAEIEAARMMRNTLMLAVLEFSQRALEQAAERAAIASRAKSQFLAKMSHELRTPLNAILGFTQIMNRSPNIPAQFQDHLSIVNRSGEHLLTLINDVLEMSKIEAGQLVLNESCFDLVRLIRLIEEMFTLKASGKALSLQVEQDATLPRYWFGDEAKLRQILINLLNNAIKFTQQGSVTLRVSAVASASLGQKTAPATAQDDRERMTLLLEVEDTGCGIATADLELIFEAFMQTDRGRYQEGTGLGLSISRQFARLMGGDITARSTLDQGSTFTCQISCSRPASMPLVEPAMHRWVVGLEPGQPTYRILVVEDVLENRQLMMTLLTSVGFTVTTVENGADAIAQWRIWQPHLILMDIQMPVMDGYEVTRQIRSQEEPDCTPTPIIALTAFAFEDDRTASLAAGCNDHIAKPFSETILFETIARYLNIHYCYSDASKNSSLPGKKTLTPQDLQIMPIEWIAQVHEAALDLNDGKIRQLITQIAASESFIIEAMTSLIDDFQMEAIATLTQS